MKPSSEDQRNNTRALIAGMLMAADRVIAEMYDLRNGDEGGLGWAELSPEQAVDVAETVLNASDKYDLEVQVEGS